MEIEEKAEKFRNDFETIRREIAKVIVGHEKVVEGVIISLLAQGHVLLEGVPGLGKTLLVRSLSQALNLKFSRIQFTPDLMPADIIGTNIIMEDESGGKSFHFQKGPVFANIILADEINRATPKTQSALLEAMQERSITVGGVTRKLDEPFLVLATQNPIEMEGTYPLPEAQIDRFFFKLIVEYPNSKELAEIVDRTTGGEEPEPQEIIDAKAVNEMRRFARRVPIASHVRDYAMRIVLATHPHTKSSSEMANKYVRYGSSPRGGQTLVLAGKIRALLHGRYNVSFEDIREVTLPALRHRLILNFEGEAEGIRTDKVISSILESVPVDTSEEARIITQG